MQGLDYFFFKEFKIEDNFPELASITKIFFSLSHGQVSTELEFNDNSVVLKQNQKDKIVVARRFGKSYMSFNEFCLMQFP